MNPAPPVPAPQPEAPVRPLRAGETCPRCGQGRLDYNGVLALACDRCDFAETEGAGCT